MGTEADTGGTNGESPQVLPQDYRALHFVGFRGDEYHRARRVFGDPDFIHIGWDRRARREIADSDTVLFATGPHDQAPGRYNYPDIKEPLWLADARTLGLTEAEIARLNGSPS